MSNKVSAKETKVSKIETKVNRVQIPVQAIIGWARLSDRLNTAREEGNKAMRQVEQCELALRGYEPLVKEQMKLPMSAQMNFQEGVALCEVADIEKDRESEETEESKEPDTKDGQAAN